MKKWAATVLLGRRILHILLAIRWSLQWCMLGPGSFSVVCSVLYRSFDMDFAFIITCDHVVNYHILLVP